MIILLYIKLIFAAFLGLGIKLSNKAKTLNERAIAGNVEFSRRDFYKTDRFVIIGSILTIALLLLVLSPIINPESLIPNDTPFSVWIFQFYRRSILEVILFCALAFGGWAGMELALKMFGQADKRINKTINDTTGPPINLTPLAELKEPQVK